jgi:hypothetical protein
MKVAWGMNKEPFLLIKSDRMVYSFFKYLEQEGKSIGH